MEKRRNRRYSKRFKVRFGLKDLTSTGFTNDVSATGMFVVTTNMLTIGQRVHVEVTLDDNNKLYFEGGVARLTLVAPELRQIMKGGFGLRFLSGAELMGEMVPHLKDKTRIVMTYPICTAFRTRSRTSCAAAAASSGPTRCTRSIRSSTSRSRPSSAIAAWRSSAG